MASERLTAAAAPGHPLLADRAEVTLADLAGYPVVCLPAGTGIRATLDAACAAAGVRLDVALEASAPGTVADLAARGLGVAVLSESMAAAHSAQAARRAGHRRRPARRPRPGVEAGPRPGGAGVLALLPPGISRRDRGAAGRRTTPPFCR